jgi:serine/threonine protein kinase
MDMNAACASLVEAAASGPGARRLVDSGSGPSAPGTRVGRYVLRRPLGAGAMGRVFVAHDPTLDREVAIKVLHPDRDDPDLEARLIREAKALGRLAPHPEVITVYDAGRDGDAVYIAMELIEGGTLRQWSARGRRSWQEIVAVFSRAGSGLAHAHAAGLVHRDFKPDNVLVGSDGRIRVTDFGLARPSFRPDEEAAISIRTPLSAMDATLTRSGVLAGTPAYMAPEQFAGRPANSQSDIFSFCVAFYEALYGERPFAAQNVVQLIERTTSGRVSPAPFGSRVPARLRRVLLVGLSPEPERRYGSMIELLAAVREVTQVRRLPRVAGAILFLGLAAIAAGLARKAPVLRPDEGAGDVHANVEIPVPAAPLQLPVEPLRIASHTRSAETTARPARPSPKSEPAASSSALAPAVQAPAPRSTVVIGANGAPILR